MSSILTGITTSGTPHLGNYVGAIRPALEKIKKPQSDITIYSDSKYVVDAVKKNWVFNWEKINFKKKKNPDLWIRFLKVYKRHNVSFIWIKGHSNNIENERCDTLAVKAAESKNLKKDNWYEKTSDPKLLF